MKSRRERLERISHLFIQLQRIAERRLATTNAMRDRLLREGEAISATMDRQAGLNDLLLVGCQRRLARIASEVVACDRDADVFRRRVAENSLRAKRAGAIATTLRRDGERRETERLVELAGAASFRQAR